MNERVRALTGGERAAMERLARALPAVLCRNALQDLESCGIRRMCNGSNCWVFEIDGYCRLTYLRQRSFPVGGRLRDADGTVMAMHVYTDDRGRLLEFELVKWSISPILHPIWSVFEVME